MTQPEPTPEEPVTEATPAEPEKPAPFDPTSLSPEAKAYIKSQVDNANYKARTEAKTKAAEEARTALLAEVAQKLGLAEDDEQVDAAELTERIETAQAQAFRAQVEHQAFRIGSKLGVDIDSALDSNRFMDDLAEAFDDVAADDPKHVGNLNPRSSAFAAEVERAMGVALEKNPRFKAAGSTGPRPDPSQGARGAGPTLDSRIAEAQKAGRWREVISLQNQKLTTT